MEQQEVLLNENSILKEGYIRLLNDKEVMLEWGKPQLEALYATKIGTLQLQRLTLQLAVKGLKRKIELIHQQIIQDIKPDFLAIELQIAQELASTEAAITRQTEQLSNARQLLSHLTSPERSAELRKLFRTVSKKLHPDVNPNITEEQLQIWYRLKEAYHSGDLEILKALEVVYEKQINHSHSSILSIADLTLQNNTLKEGIQLLEQEIEELKKQFPFTIQENINNEEWVTEQQGALKIEITELKQYEETLRTDYENLMRANG